MAVSFIKVQPNRATAERVSEAWRPLLDARQPLLDAFRVAAPAMQKAVAETMQTLANIKQPSA